MEPTLIAPKHQEMTVEEFFEWCTTQDERYELVDGFPVPLRSPIANGELQGMPGASTWHDRIASNIIVVIGGQLRGSPCWATTPDTGLRTSIKRIRRPDVTVECAPPDLKSYEARNPVAAFEILSLSTQATDKLIKLPEYMRHPTLHTIVIVVPERRSAIVYQRDADGQWDTSELRATADVIAITGTAATITLADIYDGMPADAAAA
jgi:Uma2 family endonuclease